MTDPRSRLRLVLSDSFLLIVVVLVVLTLFGGWLTYTAYAAPGTHTENQTTAEWRSTGTFDHSATIRNDSAAFSNGTTLSNQTVYFTSISPVIDGNFSYSYDALTGSLSTNVNLSFVLRSVDSSSRNTTEYWRIARQLNSEQTNSLSPEDTLTASFSRNMSAMQQVADQVEREIGGSPGVVQGVVVAQVHISGEIEEERISREQQYRMSIEFEEGQYRVADSGPTTRTGVLTQRTRVANTPSQVHSAGSVLLLIIPFSLLISLFGMRSQGLLGLDENERARLETSQTRKQFDEWITTGCIPDSVLDTPQVETGSLEGLVDVAIDTNNRVIDDLDRDRYFVFTDSVCYTFSSPQTKAAIENGK